MAKNKTPNEKGRLREQTANQQSSQQSPTNETRTAADANASPSPSPQINKELEAGRVLRDAAMWRLSNGKGSSFCAEGRIAFIKLLLVREPESVNALREVFPPREGISKNCYGPIINSLSRIGVIRKTRDDEPAKHRDAHARPVPLWELTNRNETVDWLRSAGITVPSVHKSQGTLFNDGEGV